MSELPDQEKNGQLSSDALLSILGKMMDSSTASDTQSTHATQTPPLGTDIFSSLLSNPEILSKLPQIMSMVKPLMESMPSESSAPAVQSSVPAVAQAGAMLNTHPKKHDDRTALLYAIKPYLKKERQDAIDYMVKLSRLGDILKSL
ncbi:MAG: hypothetical protein E7667_05700 [Ruminococcaceae bacterium]|nr:hypothetical protein [Oscillospiraceae bacterium]